jgi:hypothetical protein
MDKHIYEWMDVEWVNDHILGWKVRWKVRWKGGWIDT